MMESLDDNAVAQGSADIKKTGGDAQRARGKPVAALGANSLADVNVTLNAVLGQGNITVRQLLALRTGDVVDLNTALNGQVQLTLNGKLVAYGELVAVEDRFGVRISEIIPE
jgi:flagellar motor switch protein FliN